MATTRVVEPTTSDNVRAEMTRRRVSQARVADALGMSQAQVSARLKGTVDWKLIEIQTISALLGVPLAELVSAA